MDDIPETISAARVRRARKRSGETQLQFAEHFRVHQATITKWEERGVFEGLLVIGADRILRRFEKRPRKS